MPIATDQQQKIAEELGRQILDQAEKAGLEIWPANPLEDQCDRTANVNHIAVSALVTANGRLKVWALIGVARALGGALAQVPAGRRDEVAALIGEAIWTSERQVIDALCPKGHA
jgi:hypothetical protein